MCPLDSKCDKNVSISIARVGVLSGCLQNVAYTIWPTIGLPLAHCWLTFGLLLAYFWLTTGPLLAYQTCISNAYDLWTCHNKVVLIGFLCFLWRCTSNNNSGLYHMQQSQSLKAKSDFPVWFATISIFE